MKSFLLLCALGPTLALAQPCPSPTDTFWKRDTLPAIPGSTASSLSIILGFCEGEAAAVVFELPVNMPPQLLTQVVCPFASPMGANGAVALVNLEVYDGVSFSGGSVSMGTKVFDLNQQTGNDLQVTSTGLNVLDVSTLGIVVGAAPSRRFAIAFRVSLNANGTCASGYTSNLFTDNPTAFSLFCNPAITPAQTSLIDIIGQGWRDASTATVSGVPLCPLYYAGVWAIRCCTRDAPPANPFQVTPVLGVPATSPGTTVLQLVGPGLNGVPYQFGLAWSNSPPIPTPSGPIPLAFDSLLMLSLDPIASAGFFVNFTGSFDNTGRATALINVPAGLGGQGLSVYGAWVAFLPNGALAISDPLLISIP